MAKVQPGPSLSLSGNKKAGPRDDRVRPLSAGNCQSGGGVSYDNSICALATVSCIVLLSVLRIVENNQDG